MTTRRQAFTLLELVFVVAVIAVLAAIAVPNFLEAQTRAKISRAKTDLAALKLGIARYYADHGAYPPNDAEVRRYMEAALENAILDEDHTSAPEDVRINWWPGQVPPDPMTMAMENFETQEQQDGSSGNKNDQESTGSTALGIPYRDVASLSPFVLNGTQLNLLTTPVSYLGTHLPRAVFHNYAYGSTETKRDYYGYYNISEIYPDDSVSSAPGLWGSFLTPDTYAYYGSPGPSNDVQTWHPLNGPWIKYDPTNGIMSPGDFLVFEGQAPGDSTGPEEYRPKHMPHWGGRSGWW